MTYESIEELGNLLPELRRFSLELFERLGETVGDLDILAAELPQQLHIVISRNAQRGAGLDHIHDHAQHCRHLRPAVDEVAQEDRLAPLGWHYARKAFLVLADD